MISFTSFKNNLSINGENDRVITIQWINEICIEFNSQEWVRGNSTNTTNKSSTLRSSLTTQDWFTTTCREFIITNIRGWPDFRVEVGSVKFINKKSSIGFTYRGQNVKFSNTPRRVIRIRTVSEHTNEFNDELFTSNGDGERSLSPSISSIATTETSALGVELTGFIRANLVNINIINIDC